MRRWGECGCRGGCGADTCSDSPTAENSFYRRHRHGRIRLQRRYSQRVGLFSMNWSSHPGLCALSTTPCGIPALSEKSFKVSQQPWKNKTKIAIVVCACLKTYWKSFAQRIRSCGVRLKIIDKNPSSRTTAVGVAVVTQGVALIAQGFMGATL